MQNGHKVA